MSVETIATFFLGVVAAVAGYFFKRWWEGQSDRETIHDTVQLANLHKEIRSGNVSLDALNELKSDLRSRAIVQQQSREEVLAGIERAVDKENETQNANYEPQTQQEMNRYAHHLADLAEQELNFLADNLKGHLTRSEERAFNQSQKAWRAYAEKQAEFESLQAEGGSMQPMLRSSAFRLLTVERAAQIKQELNNRNQIDTLD